MTNVRRVLDESALRGPSLHNAPAVRYRFGRFDAVSLAGVDFRVLSSDEQGHNLYRNGNTHEIQFVSHEEIARYEKNGEFRYQADYFSPMRVARRKSRVSLLAELSPEMQQLVLFRKTYCDAFLEAEASKEVTHSDESINALIKRVSAKIVERDAARVAGGKPCGKEIKYRLPPSAKTLRGWVKRYVAAGCDPLALIPHFGRSGNGNSRLDPRLQELLEEHAQRYASTTRPSKQALYKLLTIEIEDENVKRAAAGLEPLLIPSYSTLCREINDLDPYLVFVGRYGEDAARRKFYITRRGLEVLRPHERIECDEVKLPVHTLLKGAGAFLRIPDDIEQEVARKRVWISVAFDVGTRCYLAVLPIYAPSAITGVETLRRAISDKTLIAKAAGCQSRWIQRGNIELVATDGGSAFISSEFELCVLDLGATLHRGPAKRPQGRGTIERGHRTICSGLLEFVDGKTFQDAVAKGDYDAEAMATLLVEEAARLMVRYIVDVYHNTPHGGLGGETPANAWVRLTNDYGVIPAPDAERMRHIFGVTLERKISNSGVRVLGIAYQSYALQQLRRTKGSRPVQLRVDVENLGAVSVKTDEGWLVVKCLHSEFEGLALGTWLEAAAKLRRENARMAKLARPIVLAAIRDIKAVADAARERAGLCSPILSNADFARWEKQHFNNWRVEFEADEVEPVLDDNWAPSAVTEDPAFRGEDIDEIVVADTAEIGDDDFFVED